MFTPEKTRVLITHRTDPDISSQATIEGRAAPCDTTFKFLKRKWRRELDSRRTPRSGLL
jgi:hypothetical protein